MRPPTKVIMLIAARVAGPALAAACGSSTPSASSGSGTGSGTSSGSGSGITWSPAGTFGTKPTVVVPTGAPPTTLQTRDLIVGSGAAATASSTVTVQYDGYSWSTKKEFQASWTNGGPVAFPLNQVIP